MTLSNLAASPTLEEPGPERGFSDLAESIVQNIDEVFFWRDPADSTPYFVNQAYERIWGWSCQSVYTNPSSWTESIHPEDRERVTAEFELATKYGQVQVEYRIVRPDGAVRWISSRTFPHRDKSGQIRTLIGIAQDCTERIQGEKSRAFLASIIEASDDSIVGTDLSGQIISWNRAAERLFGYTAQEAIGHHIMLLFPPDNQADQQKVLKRITDQERIERFESVRIAKDGRPIDVSVIVAGVRDSSGRVQGVYANYRDIADRKRAERDRKIMEVQLRHAQKLESIGQLAAGIAHEINTPTQYIGDNTRFLLQAFSDLEPLMRGLQELLETAPQSLPAEDVTRQMRELANAVDIGYLVTEIPLAIAQTLEGVKRVATLVSAMKEFSHPGTKEKLPLNLNHSIDSTITVTRNEWKYVADVETDYDPSLPMVPCLPGDFNQVMVNLIVNAAHAISDAAASDGKRGKITVRTRNESPWVRIEVEDTGTGIPEDVRERVFEPFFTTKEVGRGTGQGLAIAHSVVVDKHGGRIGFDTVSGKGTTFVVRLPLQMSDAAAIPSPPA